MSPKPRRNIFSPDGDVGAVPEPLRLALCRLQVGGGVAGRQVRRVAVHERLVGARSCAESRISMRDNSYRESIHTYEPSTLNQLAAWRLVTLFKRLLARRTIARKFRC